MEVDEEQLSLFGESVLQLHDKIFEMVGLMNTQVEVNSQLAEIVKRLNDNVQFLMNDKYNNESERIRLQQRVDMLENDIYMKTPYGSRSHEKLNDVVNQMKQQMDRYSDVRLTTSLMAMMEIFRIHLTQIEERDKAEILSLMSSTHGQVEMAYQLGVPYNPQELLQLAARLLNQPESIITLYR